MKESRLIDGTRLRLFDLFNYLDLSQRGDHEHVLHGKEPHPVDGASFEIF